MTPSLSIQSFALALVCLALGACSSSHVDDDAGRLSDAGSTDAGTAVDSGSPPVDASRPDAGMCMDPPAGESRPAAYDCSPCRPPGPGGATSGDCSEDSDCGAGENGRCVFSRIGGTCSYDECFADSDCASTELCACDGGSGGGNACVEAGCHTDADCGSYTCAPTLGECGHYFPPVGYYCHGADDACQSDAECATGYCAYDPTTSRWGCSDAECVG